MTYTRAQRASGGGGERCVPPPPEGETPELCRLLALGKDPRGGRLLPASGRPLAQTSRPGWAPFPSLHWGQEWTDTFRLASPVTKRG